MTNCALVMSKISFCPMCIAMTLNRSIKRSKPRSWHGECGASFGHHCVPRHGLLRSRHCAVYSIAQQISQTFADLDLQHDVGPLKIKISGCINACGIIMWVILVSWVSIKRGQATRSPLEDGTESAVLGTRTGPGFSYEKIVPAITLLIETYLAIRSSPEETFLEAYRRLGMAPFKAALYEVSNVAA